MISPQSVEFAEAIDKACDNNNKEELTQQMSYIHEYIQSLDDSQERAYLSYCLSNAWNGLRNINHEEDKSTIWKLEQKELFKEIYYLRKAILEEGFDKLDMNLKLSIYTNLGNVFSHYGRTINALKYYDQALKLNDSFFMALSNRAMCLEVYARLNYDHNHQSLFLKSAYFDYKQANIKIQNHLKQDAYDGEYYKGIQSTNELSTKKIENYLTRNWLDESIDLNSHALGESTNEIYYRKWVLDNTLFLNPMNDMGNFSIAAHDPLTLPNMLTRHFGIPKYISYFNQIKQEYISYRYLLFEGLKKPVDKFYNKETSIIDDFDCNLHDINIEKIKLAFRGFYSLFDKVANFMNEYFELGLNDKQVDFRRIWYSNTRNSHELNPIFNESENLALRGLYLISKDLYFNNKDEESKEFIAVLEPEAKKINEIRNHLEHKFIMIKILDVKNIDLSFEKEERCFYIVKKDLESKTIHLGKLVREAIINLSFAVHIEENKKELDGKYASIPLTKMKE